MSSSSTSISNTPNIVKSKPYFVGQGKTVRQEIIIRGIKLIDIAYINTIYLTLGAVLSICLDKQLGKFDPKTAEEKSVAILSLEVLLHFALLGMFFYIVRNVVEWIPFPLHGKFGYDHLKVKELSNAGAFVTVFLLLQVNLKDKILYVSKRLESKLFKKHNILFFNI